MTENRITVPTISADMLAQDVTDRYPQTIKVLLKHHMRCVGCHISTHHRLADCARENDMDLDLFLAELNEVLSETSGEQGT